MAKRILPALRRGFPALGLLALLACATAPTAQPVQGLDVAGERQRLAEQALAGDGPAGRRVLAVVFGDEQEIAALSAAGVRDVLARSFVTRPIRISNPYDEAANRRYWRRHFGQAVSFQFYLLHRNVPYTARDLATLRRLGVVKTPAFLLLDGAGKTLWTSQGDPALDPELLRRFVAP
jgi:hypothetical protein